MTAITLPLVGGEHELLLGAGNVCFMIWSLAIWVSLWEFELYA